MNASGGHLSEEPGVAPRKAAPLGLQPDPLEFNARWLAASAFPSGDGRLRHSGDVRKLRLSDPENLTADVSQLVHDSGEYSEWTKQSMNVPRSDLGCGYSVWHTAVMDDVGAVLRGIMTARDWSQEELADHLNSSQGAVSKWLRGDRTPGGLTMERIRELAVESRVIEPEPVTVNQAPLMGRVGAGAKIEVEFEQPPPEGFDTVELLFSYGDGPIIAFEIEGDSMIPAYDPGTIIICLRDQVRATDHYLGERAVVRTSTGERYLKRLARGPSKGTYNLESWNARTIEGVKIEWVGEILGTAEPNAVRRIERRHQAQAKKRSGATRGNAKI